MKKMIFIDVDGTLVGQDGSIPTSAKKAISEAKEQNHEIIICTGRSMGEITQEIKDIEPNGFIAAGGSYIEYNNNVIQHIKIEEEKVKEIISYFNSKDIAYYLESNSGIYPSDNCIEKIREATDIVVQESPEKFRDIDYPYPEWFISILSESLGKKAPHSEINKISFINTKLPLSKIKDEYSDVFEVYETTVFEFGKKSGEIGLKGLDKQDGIEKLLNFVDDVYKTYAYGDGLNDISMFMAVDVKIAMDNADQKLKDIADEITDIAEKDGLFNSFFINNLI